MNGERTIKIVVMDITKETLVLESELERIINSDIDTNLKISKIKEILGNIVTNEASIAKFQSMINTNENNITNNQKPNENGTN